VKIQSKVYSIRGMVKMGEKKSYEISLSKYIEELMMILVGFIHKLDVFFAFECVYFSDGDSKEWI
jgi:hypothetical protein